MTSRWKSALALAVLAVFTIIAASYVMGDAFGGTDDAAGAAVAATGHEPWFNSLLELGKTEELLAFSAQGAIGGGVLGYVLGAFRERDRQIVKE